MDRYVRFQFPKHLLKYACIANSLELGTSAVKMCLIHVLQVPHLNCWDLVLVQNNKMPRVRNTITHILLLLRALVFVLKLIRISLCPAFLSTTKYIQSVILSLCKTCTGKNVSESKSSLTCTLSH